MADDAVVPVDAVEDDGGPAPGGQEPHSRSVAAAGVEEASADGSPGGDVARRAAGHPADGNPD
jgi:hypothetical protein